MKNSLYRWSYLSIFLCLLAAISCDQPPAEEDSDAIAFVDVNVIPMNEEGITEQQIVIIRNGRIDEVGAASQIELSEDVTRVDGSGRYLIPGLTEMHAHVPGSDDMEYLQNVLYLYISNGVTTIRNMAGQQYHIELRDQISNGEIPGPTMYTASPWLGDNNVPTPDDAEKIVGKYHEAGFDLLKIGSISPEAYDRMAAEANELGIPFAGHIPEGVGLERALEVGQKSIDHFDRYVEFLVPEDEDIENRDSGFFGSGIVELADTNRIQEAVERTIEAGTWNVPTLSLVEHLASAVPGEKMIQRSEMQYMPQDVLDGWVEAKNNFDESDNFQPEAAERLVEIRRHLLRSLHDAGAPIALGSDAPQFFNVPGFSIHHEMRMMVDAGLSPYEVLVTGTRNPAVYFDESDEFGTVEVGRRADLILLEANPLEDIANMERRAGVMVRGKWMPESEIQQRLDEISASLR